MLKIIVTGTGRSGTGFVAKLLTSAGIKCGHERFFSHGGLDRAEQVSQRHWVGTIAESSWLAAPFLDCDLLKDALIIHVVRHPKKVIESMLRVAPEVTPDYHEFACQYIEGLADIEGKIDQATYRYLKLNQMIEAHTNHRDSILWRIEDEPDQLLKQLEERGFEIDYSDLFDNRRYNHKAGHSGGVDLKQIKDDRLRDDLAQMSERYNYKWPGPAKGIVKAVITTLDNLSNLKEQIMILRQEPIAEFIVVNNGSQDGSKEWLDQQKDLTIIHRENNGAGPGRNAGLNAVGEFDYVLMLDGGIRPLYLGTQRLLDYLSWCEEADVIGLEIPHFETDREKAWRRWPEPILANHTYRNTRLSHTAYCLARRKAFDGLRFSEDGPFAEPGWGADDDYMAYRWLQAGIKVHVVTNIHPYRHASGSFRRLHQETGVWPNQYGSVYEQRVVWLTQNWPQFEPVGQWGEPWLTVVIKAEEINNTAKLIKMAHDKLRERRFKKPYENNWNPYHVHVWGDDPDWLKWAELRHLRQHHGSAIIGYGGRIIQRDKKNEDTWTGDFIINTNGDWQSQIRPGAFYYGLVENEVDLEALLARYDEVHPPQPTKKAPKGEGQWLLTP